MNYDNSNVAPSTKDGGDALHEPPNTPTPTTTQPHNDIPYINKELSGSKLMGNVFLVDDGGVWNYSVHFDEEGGCYISFDDSRNSSTKYDDGSEWTSPRRFFFSEQSYDSVERRFCGLAEFGGSLFGGFVSMKFEMVFDTEFVCVLSGSCTIMKVDGEKGDSATIGEDVIYTNASLDGRVDTHTLQRLEDEGASEKTIGPFRHPRIQELVQIALRDKEEKEARRLQEISLREEKEKRRLREIELQKEKEARQKEKDARELQEKREDPCYWALTYEQLLEVRNNAMTNFNDFKQMTMRDISDRIIKVVCRREERSFALSKNPNGLKTDVFVSHSWDELFGPFVQSIEEVYHSQMEKPNLWICAFALFQGSAEEIQTQLGTGEIPLKQSPFVRALKGASSYLVVRNSETDLCSRIWVICEIMFAKEFNFIPAKTRITGPDTFANSEISCLHAKSSDMDDQIKILKELLNNSNPKEIDDFIKKFRSYGSSLGATFQNTTSSRDDTVSLEEFLGKLTFETLKSDLDEFGVIAVEDFNELDEEDIDHLGGKLKKVNAKRFLRKVADIRK